MSSLATAVCRNMASSSSKDEVQQYIAEDFLSYKESLENKDNNRPELYADPQRQKTHGRDTTVDEQSSDLEQAPGTDMTHLTY